MYNKREVIDFLEDTLYAMEKAELFITDMTYEEFLKDEKTIFAVIRAIEVIGEALKHVPSKKSKRKSLQYFNDTESKRPRSSGLWQKEKLKLAAMLTFWSRLRAT